LIGAYFRNSGRKKGRSASEEAFGSFLARGELPSVEGSNVPKKTILYAEQKCQRKRRKNREGKKGKRKVANCDSRIGSPEWRLITPRKKTSLTNTQT